MTAEFEGILDHYIVLGVDRQCSCADIRKAFRAAALKWHPDKAGTSPEARRRFQEAADAYEVLCDPQRREAYDVALHQARVEAAASQPAPHARPHRNPSSGYPKPQSPGAANSGHPAQAWAHPNSPPEASKTWQRTAKDTRPTAAELHPQGFGPPFRASISDLQTLATFSHEGAVWLPKVKDVKWCRPDGDARRVQLSFVADYTSSRSRGHVVSPLVQWLQTSTCDALHTSFQEHLDRVAGRCDCRHFRMQLLDFPGRGELQFRVKLRLEGALSEIRTQFLYLTRSLQPSLPHLPICKEKGFPS